MRFINNTRLRFGWAFAAGLSTFLICTPLSGVLVCLDRGVAGGSFVGYFPTQTNGTPFRGAPWLYYIAETLYWIGWGGLGFAVIVGAFRKKTGTTNRATYAGWLTRWNAQLTGLSAVAFSLIPVVFMFAWFGWGVPYLSNLLKPLEVNSPFLYDILHSLVGVLVLPWSFGAMVFALYLYQGGWDRLHSQPNQLACDAW
jgi:hypothetical protein